MMYEGQSAYFTSYVHQSIVDRLQSLAHRYMYMYTYDYIILLYVVLLTDPASKLPC